MQCVLGIISYSAGVPIPGNKCLIDLGSDELARHKEVVILPSTSSISDTIYSLKQNISNIAVLCTVISSSTLADSVLVEVYCKCRVHIISVHEGSLPKVEYEEVVEDFTPGEEIVAEHIEEICKYILANSSLFGLDLLEALRCNKSLIGRMDIIASHVIGSEQDRLRYIQSQSHVERFSILSDALERYTSRKIRRIRTRNLTAGGTPLDKPMRSLRERVFSADLPAYVRDILDKELTRLSRLSKSSIEYASTQDYIECVLDIPWGKTTFSGSLCINDISRQLDETHYGLDTAKEYLIEHLAIESILNRTSGTVLCFTGPPGTGKTSLAKALAKVVGRPMQKIALGGLSDESEIRGHRRTYASSRPGRVIQALQRAESMDPLIVLDEIDKVAMYRGDPTGALLELLDTTQNSEFFDRYLGFPVDVSKVMFICTANDRSEIPGPLADRLEFIEFENYSSEERFIILRDYIRPRIIDEYSISGLDITITDDILEDLAEIEELRQAERAMRKLYRAAVVDILGGKSSAICIDGLRASPILDRYVHSSVSRIGF